MPEIRQTKLLFDGADFLDSFIKTIFPKLLMLDLLELVTHLVIFLGVSVFSQAGKMTVSSLAA